MILFMILTLTFTTGGHGGPVPKASGSLLDTPKTPTVCPLQKVKEDFDMSKFLGEWYVLEYVYDKPKEMKAFGCMGFDFSMTDQGELKTNFTFKFPTKTGFFYHVPSYSPVNTIMPGIWDSKHRGEELTSLILDTDYKQWAVLTQCKKSSDASSPKFLSTRILSRSRVLSREHLQTSFNVVKKAHLEVPFQYSVDQTSCKPRKKKTQISAIIKRMRALRKNWTTVSPQIISTSESSNEKIESSNKPAKIAAIIRKMREKRKKWTTSMPFTTEKIVPIAQDAKDVHTPSTLAFKKIFSSPRKDNLPHNGAWRIDGNNILYILLLLICTHLKTC